MKSVNGDSALWNKQQRGSSNSIAGPSCCWVIGCCWYWYEMASKEAAGLDPVKA